MAASVVFKPTSIQKKALALLKSGAKHILLFGGSRSGKTTVLVIAIIARALKYRGSRHLICRYRAKDTRSSVLRETLLPWLDRIEGAKLPVWLRAKTAVSNRSISVIKSLGHNANRFIILLLIVVDRITGVQRLSQDTA